MDLMAIRRRMLASIAAVRKILHTITSATGIVSFSTALAEPVESLVCEFSPVQAGSGDPSPTNVRPITGWTGLTVGRAADGFLCIPKSGTHWESNGIVCDYIANGTFWVRGTATATANIDIPVVSFTIPSGDGRLFEMKNNPAASGATFVLLTSSSSQIDSWGMTSANRTSSGYSAMAGKTVGIVRFAHTSGKTVDYIIAPTFIKYKQTDISVNWQSTAGTVYGGSLNVTTGVLTATRVYATLDGSDDETITAGTSGTQARWYMPSSLRSAVLLPASSSKITDAIASYLTMVTQGSNWNSKDNIFAMSSGGYVFMRCDTIGALANWKAYLALNPLHFCFPLKTASYQTYQLTPQQVSTLIGQNTIWHDANGSISVDYYDTQ